MGHRYHQIRSLIYISSFCHIVLHSKKSLSKRCIFLEDVGIHHFKTVHEVALVTPTSGSYIYHGVIDCRKLKCEVGMTIVTNFMEVSQLVLKFKGEDTESMVIS